MRTSILKRCMCYLCLFTLVACGAAVVWAATYVGGGVDDPLGVFQLEGNASTDPSVCFPLTAATSNGCPNNGTPNVTFSAATEDWDKISTSTSASAIATSFSTDLVNSQSDTIFTGGGSKDTNDISSWLWKTAKTGQAKDDIAHAYAAAYTFNSTGSNTANNGHTVIYFGMDRYDNSGDSTAGFWFVQDPTISFNGTAGGGGTHFTGKHTEGDLLIVSDFSTGGATNEIVVFTWHNGALVQDIDKTTAATCNPTSGSSSLCAITNPVDGTPAPWSFTNKSNQHTFAHGEFLEGGIDLNAIFGNNVPCFSNFFAETRASTAPTATLSDITTPVQFGLCKFKVDKKCDGKGTVNANGNIDYSWTITVTNPSGHALYDVDVFDTLPDGTKVTEHVVTSTTTPNVLAGNGGTATKTVTFTATKANQTDPTSVTNTITGGDAADSEGGVQSVVAVPASGTTFAAPTCTADVSSAIGVSKNCDNSKGGAILTTTGCASASDVCVEVFFTATVTNGTTSVTSNEELDSITLQDNPTATFDTFTGTTTGGKPVTVTGGSTATIDKLQPGDSVILTGHYFPSTIDKSGVAGRYLFNDTVHVISATGTITNPKAPANNPCTPTTDLACATVTQSDDTTVGCPICPSGSCSTVTFP